MPPIRPVNYNYQPPKQKLYKKLLPAAVFLIVLFGLILWFRPHTNSPASTKVRTGSSGTSTGTSNSGSIYLQFNKKQYSLNDPSSLWAIANKGRVLPSDYVPAGLVNPDMPLRLSPSNSEMMLRSDAAEALAKLYQAAKKDSVNLMLASGYRAYSEQVVLYNRYVAQDGQSAADTYSARPGHSEHQLGLSADVEPASRTCEVQQCFADTAEGKWVAANAYKYGFVIRYPKGKESQTGYEYEPWHLRFVGTALSAQINKTGQTLEQFFGLPYYSYYPDSPYRLSAGS